MRSPEQIDAAIQELGAAGLQAQSAGDYDTARLALKLIQALYWVKGCENEFGDYIRGAVQ